MSGFGLDLTIFGGKADAAGVEVSTVASILRGLSADLVDVCRNISQEDTDTPWNDRLRSCRLYVKGSLRSKKSVVIPCVLEQGDVPWGERSGRVYVDGLAKLQGDPACPDPWLPDGFDAQILKRVRTYFEILRNDYSGMTLRIRENGKTASEVRFDSRLHGMIERKLAQLEPEKSAATDPLSAVERLIALTEGMMADESLQSFMDRVRERG